MGQNFSAWFWMASNIGLSVSWLIVYMCFFPCFWMVTRLHSSKGLRLWEIMLCSCLSAIASSFTLMDLFINCSSVASLVGFARLVKNL